MKDYSFYRSIICKYYNPKKEELTKKSFYQLHKGILAGDTTCAKELFRLTCFFSYDLVAHAYAEGIMTGDFEDALQETFLLMKKVSMGIGPNKKTAPYFSTISYGTSFEHYKNMISKLVSRHLIHKQTSEETFSHQKSFEINELLQNPENIAVTEMDRKQVAQIVAQSGYGKHEDVALKHSIWFYEQIMKGFEQPEIARYYKVTKQAVGQAFNKSVTNIQNNPEKLDELEGLLH